MALTSIFHGCPREELPLAQGNFRQKNICRSTTRNENAFSTLTVPEATHGNLFEGIYGECLDLVSVQVGVDDLVAPLSENEGFGGRIFCLLC